MAGHHLNYLKRWLGVVANLNGARKLLLLIRIGGRCSMGGDHGVMSKKIQF